MPIERTRSGKIKYVSPLIKAASKNIGRRVEDLLIKVPAKPLSPYAIFLKYMIP